MWPDYSVCDFCPISNCPGSDKCKLKHDENRRNAEFASEIEVSYDPWDDEDFDDFDESYGSVIFPVDVPV